MSSGWLPTVLIGAALTSFVLSVGLTWFARRVARRIGFVDRPGGHKSHREPIPYGGGLAMFWAATLPIGGVVLAALLAEDNWLRERCGEYVRALAGGLREKSLPTLLILGGALVMHVLGLIDDVRPLGALPKLATIVGAALALSIFGEVRLATALGAPASIALSVLWIVVVTNAANFLDNMDGLSAGVGGICTLFLVICGVMAGQVLVPGLGALWLGAIGGFLIFNFPPARIFMGDAGSLVLGYMLAVLSILTTYYESAAGSPPYALAIPLVVLAVPLYDFASVVVIRLLEGRNPLRGDQRHFSHRLVQRGLTRRFAVLTIYLATAATGLCGTLLPGATTAQVLVVLAIVASVLAIIAILEAPLRNDP